MRRVILISALAVLAGAVADAASPAEAATAAATVEPSLWSWDYWEVGKRSENVRNFGLLAAAVVGLGFGIWRAITGHLQAKASIRQATASVKSTDALLTQARTAEAGHITERFSRAVDQLGNEQLPVRLGGIYALWRLAEDTPEQYTTTVVDILCAFVRNPPHPENVGARADGTEDDQTPAETDVWPDVQAILDLICARPATYRRHLPEGYRLDLMGALLQNARLAGGNLERAQLFHADLSEANLAYAILTATSLIGTNLAVAYLIGANLSGANLYNANLDGANLDGANLTDADLDGADLTDANLTDADLVGARNLTQDQLDVARVRAGGAPPKLPDGLRSPTKIWSPRA